MWSLLNKTGNNHQTCWVLCIWSSFSSEGNFARGLQSALGDFLANWHRWAVGVRAATIGPFNFIRILQAVLVDGQTILHFTRKRWDVLARDDERGQIEQVQKHFVAVAVTQVVSYF
jgi:hypothetical protein